MRWLVVLVLLGAVAYGGYYAYCRYEVKERRHHFSQEALDLRQSLLRLRHAIGPQDIRQVVQRFAERAGVVVEPAGITPVMQPLTQEAMRKLPGVAQRALGIAAKMKNHTSPQMLVGFRAKLLAEHGIVSERFEEERYTWWQP